MAAMKARRPARTPNEPAPRKRRRGAPPSGPLPRVMAIRGAFDQPPTPQESLRGAAMGVLGLILFSGAAIAGATWIGGSLFDASEAFARSADHLAARTGFAVNMEKVAIEGVDGARAEEVRAAINPEQRLSLIALDPVEVKARVEALDWVQSARVRRLFPSSLEIEVERRQAFALWREDGLVSVIDLDGRPLAGENPADNSDLPVLQGRGAGPAASEILTALEELPAVRDRAETLTRVGDRRWDVTFQSGAVAMLPEIDMTGALTALARLQGENQILDRPIARIDLRVRGLMIARVARGQSGAAIALAGDA